MASLEELWDELMLTTQSGSWFAKGGQTSQGHWLKAKTILEELKAERGSGKKLSLSDISTVKDMLTTRFTSQQPTTRRYGFAIGSPQFIISYGGSDFDTPIAKAKAINATVLRADHQTGTGSAYGILASRATAAGLLMTPEITDHIKAGHTVASVQAQCQDLINIANSYPAPGTFPRPLKIELGNEPNGPQYGGNPNASEYVTLAAAAAAKFRAAWGTYAAGGPELICAGLSQVGTVPPSSIEPITYLQSIITAGINNHVDSYAFHTEDDNAWNVLLPNFRQKLLDNGISKIIHITENDLYTAPGSGGQSEAQQASRITNRINNVKTIYNAFVGDWYEYSLWDLHTASSNPQDNYGVYRNDWTAKAGASAFAIAVI